MLCDFLHNKNTAKTWMNLEDIVLSKKRHLYEIGRIGKQQEMKTD